MEFRELAANETAALLGRLKTEWAHTSARELRTLRDALSTAAQVAEAALTAPAHAKDEDVHALADRLGVEADSRAKALADRVAKDAKTTINAVRKELHDRSQEKDRLAAQLGQTRGELERLRQELEAQTARAVEAERDLDQSRRELEAARAESSCVMKQLEAEAAERAKLTVALNTALMLQKQRPESNGSRRAAPEPVSIKRETPEDVTRLASLPISRLRAKFQHVEGEP